MPRRYYQYLPKFQNLHDISSIGSFILGIGFIIMAIYLIHSLVKGAKATSNPWGALTLEWQTSSPPPTSNFLTEPKIPDGFYDYDKIPVKSSSEAGISP
jgi:cytochrome c oxidase subunit 1